MKKTLPSYLEKIVPRNTSLLKQSQPFYFIFNGFWRHISISYLCTFTRQRNISLSSLSKAQCSLLKSLSSIKEKWQTNCAKGQEWNQGTCWLCVTWWDHISYTWPWSCLYLPNQFCRYKSMHFAQITDLSTRVGWCWENSDLCSQEDPGFRTREQASMTDAILHCTAIWKKGAVFGETSAFISPNSPINYLRVKIVAFL